MLYFTIFLDKSAKFFRDYFFAHPGFRRYTNVITITDIRLKIWPWPAFQRHSGHRNRHGSIGYLWIPIKVP